MVTRTQRTLPVAVLVIALLMLTAACGMTGGGSASDTTKDPVAAGQAIDGANLPKGVKIDFWHIQATIYGVAVADIVKEFNATNEWGIVVNQVYKGSYTELNQAIRASLAGGGAPDVAMAYENDILEYQRAGEVVELDPYLKSTKYGVPDAKLADMVPGVLARQRIPAYKGLTLSWPHGNSAYGMYYNIDMLAKAGISKPPATYDEFLADARQMKKATGGSFVSMSLAHSSDYFNMLRSKGVTPYDPQAAATKFGSPESVAALKLIDTLYKEKLAYTAAGGTGTETEFTNQRVPIELGTTARSSTKIEQIGDKFTWGLAMSPSDAAPITQLFGGNHVILKSGGDANEHLAAWLFMRYFADTTAQSKYAAATGYSPAVKSALGTPLLKADYAKNPQKSQAFDQVFVNAQILPATSAGNAINDLVDKAVETVVQGKATPEEAAKRMDADGTSLLAAAKK
jgi:ABC-type glycerol-3-phosphate transport system substrate-binding protein